MAVFFLATLKGDQPVARGGGGKAPQGGRGGKPNPGTAPDKRLTENKGGKKK